MSARANSIGDSEKIIVVRTDKGYWGSGKDLETALQRLRESWATGSQSAVINAYTGAPEALKGVSVSSYGDVSYPQSVTSIRIGRCKLPMKQPKFD